MPTAKSTEGSNHPLTLVCASNQRPYNHLRVCYPKRNPLQQAIPFFRPVVDGDILYCMTGYEGYSLLALPLSASGDSSKTDAILRSRQYGTPYVPSPLLYDGLLFFNQSDNAIWSCVDSKTGDTILQRTQLQGISRIYASPVGADGRIYIPGRSGTTIVLECAKELKILATNHLDDTIDASLALAGNQLFARGKRSLYCIEQ